MFTKRILALSTVLILALSTTPVRAGVRIGIGLNFPLCGPCCYGYPYYYAPVYAAPVVVQAPLVYQPAYAVPAAPAPLPAPTPVGDRALAPSLAPALTPTPATPHLTQLTAREDEVDACLRDLAGGDDRARTVAAVQLGRLHAARSVEVLKRTLSEDRSPAVREAAARGLGLLASPSALDALEYAAQGDDDREVRHSAAFAAEVIRANLSGR